MEKFIVYSAKIAQEELYYLNFADVRWFTDVHTIGSFTTTEKIAVTLFVLQWKQHIFIQNSLHHSMEKYFRLATVNIKHERSEYTF